jgi:hypothetical protein
MSDPKLHEEEGYYYAKVGEREQPIIVKVWAEVIENNLTKEGRKGKINLYIQHFESDKVLETETIRLLRKVSDIE